MNTINSPSLCSNNLQNLNNPILSQELSLQNQWVQAISQYTQLLLPLSTITATYLGIIGLHQRIRDESTMSPCGCSDDTLALVSTPRFSRIDLSKVLCGPQDAKYRSQTDAIDLSNVYYRTRRNYAAFENLLKQPLLALSQLNVSHCAMNDAGVKIIVANSPFLTDLDLSGNRVLSTKALSYVSCLTRLHTLALRGMFYEIEEDRDDDFESDLSNRCLDFWRPDGCNNLQNISQLTSLNVSSNAIKATRHFSDSFISLVKKLKVLIANGGSEISEGTETQDVRNQWIATPGEFDISQEQLQELRRQAPDTTIISDTKATSNDIDIEAVD